MEREQKLIFTRHLATQFNRERRLMGRKFDLSIERDGQIESFIESLNRFNDKEKIDPKLASIISSPLQRCLETSQLIKTTLHIPHETSISDLVTETDLGDFSGYKGSDLRSEYGNMVDEWMHNPCSFIFPNGEGYKDVESRVRKFMDFLNDSSEFEDKTHLIVCSHVDFIKMFLLAAQSRSFDERRSFDIKNGSISVVEIRKDDLKRNCEYKVVLVNF